MPIFRFNNLLKIEILIFRFKNNNLEFNYKILDQINIFEFKLKISYSNLKCEIQIMF